MTLFQVEVSSDCEEKIANYASYIEHRSASRQVALDWMERVYARIQTLKYHPKRHACAEENRHRDYEIRRLIIGNYLALYTVDDEARSVRVIGFRHASRLPRPNELPECPSD